MLILFYSNKVYLKKGVNMFSKKGQVSIEILIVLSILIIAGVVFGVYYISNLNKTTQDLDNNEVTNVTDTFRNSLNDFAVEITSPQNNATYQTEENINFRVGFIDQNGTPTCVWQGAPASVTACNGTGSFDTAGTKRITVIATDETDTNATYSVLITVEPAP